MDSEKLIKGLLVSVLFVFTLSTYLTSGPGSETEFSYTSRQVFHYLLSAAVLVLLFAGGIWHLSGQVRQLRRLIRTRTKELSREKRMNRVMAEQIRLRNRAETYLMATDPERVERTGTDSGFIARVESFITMNLSDPELNVSSLAKALYMDRSTLYRRLVRETGAKPGRLITEMRLRRAAEMLNRQEGTVSEIAYEAGFNSIAYFSRCFREKYGVPPSEFSETKTKIL